MNPKRNNLIALLGALCFFFSTIEYMIPKPLPFLRLGLANLPLLVGIELLTVPQLALVVLIKVIGQGLIGGTLFSYIFLFSAAGTITSALIMIFLKKLCKGAISYAGVSIAGALTSNLVQLTMARYVIFSESAWLIGPPFIALGTITSLLLGIFANYFVHTSQWFAATKNRIYSENPQKCFEPEKTEPLPAQEPVSAENPRESAKNKKAVHPLLFFFLGLIILLALLFAPNLWWTIGIFTFIVLIVLFSRQRIPLLPVLLMSFSIILFNLLTPSGQVIYQSGSFRLTWGALFNGIKKALTVEGMIFLSRWMIRPDLKLPGSFGTLISRSFTILEKLTEQKGAFDRKKIIQSIDRILEKC